MTSETPAEPLVPQRIVLRTSRLVLREMDDDDLEDMLAYRIRNRAHLERWEGAGEGDSYYTTQAVARAILWWRAEKTARRALRFIVRRDDGATAIVAKMNLFQIERGALQSGTIGYSVDVGCEGSGYMREAAEAVVTYAFAELGLHRIAANYQPHNVRSGKLLKRLGFAVEGYARDFLFIDGAWRDHVLTARYNPDWRIDRP
jgi:ribosomal-protein-alanine N-acetyltransferase